MKAALRGKETYQGFLHIWVARIDPYIDLGKTRYTTLTYTPTFKDIELYFSGSFGKIENYTTYYKNENEMWGWRSEGGIKVYFKLKWILL